LPHVSALSLLISLPLSFSLYNIFSFSLSLSSARFNRFARQGTFLTASGATAKVWSGRTGALLRVYRNIVDKEITAICFDESLKKFIVGDAQGNVKVFNFLNGSGARSA
jgi:hypothetical protein